MKPIYHAAVSLMISALVWLWLRSISAALGCFLAGVFVDLDHIIDYYLAYGGRFRPRHLCYVFEFEAFNNILVLLHAWEWIPVALLIVWLTDWQPVGLGLVIGFTIHLILDHLINNHSPWAYFISYRLAHCFSGYHYYGEQEYNQRLKQSKKVICS